MLLENEKDISQENIVQEEDIDQEEIVCKPDIEVKVNETALTADYRSRVLEIEYEDEKDKATESHNSLITDVFEVEDDEEEDDQASQAGAVKTEIKCNVCGKVITRRCFRKHMKKMHQQIVSASEYERKNKMPEIHNEIAVEPVVKVEQATIVKEDVADQSILEIGIKDKVQQNNQVTEIRKNIIECTICGKTIKRSCFKKHIKRMHPKNVSALDFNGKTTPIISDKNTPNHKPLNSRPYHVTKCKLCDKDMLKKSIALHMKRAHEVSTEETGDETVRKISDLLHSTSDEIREMKNQLNKKDNLSGSNFQKNTLIGPEEHDIKVKTEDKNKYNRSAVQDKIGGSNLVTSSLGNNGSCDQCDKSYSSRKNMRRHRFSAHPEQYK